MPTQQTANTPPTTTPKLPSARIPSWLSPGSKCTYERDGQYHKVFVSRDTTEFFLESRKPRARTFVWKIPFPDIRSTWPQLVEENILLPGWTTSTFKASNATHVSSPTIASHVSAASLKSSCPRTLREALQPDNPDRPTWLESYNEEYDSLLDHNVFDVITYDQYQTLKPRCGKALPTMCVNVIKPDKAGNPKRAKSRIVVLGNQELCSWTKSDCYALVMEQQHLRLLVSDTISNKRILKQGNFKNAFCHPNLPDDECYVVKPPVDCPLTPQLLSLFHCSDPPRRTLLSYSFFCCSFFSPFSLIFLTICIIF